MEYKKISRQIPAIVYNRIMNWKILIRRIKRLGKLSDAQVAKKVKSTQQNINALRLGATRDPRWSLGDRLLGLDKKLRSKPVVKPPTN